MKKDSYTPQEYKQLCQDIWDKVTTPLEMISAYKTISNYKDTIHLYVEETELEGKVGVFVYIENIFKKLPKSIKDEKSSRS